MMKFECLPNEILIEVFEYLDGFEIFYSFVELNSRFSKLIRTIPLKLNFENIPKSIYDKFCKILLSDSSINSQIYSLQFSNSDTYYQSGKFLSLFSLEEFVNLQSLRLIEIGRSIVEQFKFMLPSLSNLSYFHLIDQKYEAKELLSVLPISNLRTLSAGDTCFDRTTFNQISSIEKLTLTCSSWDILYHLLKYTPELKYLNIQMFTTPSPSDTDEKDFVHTYPFQLKTLVLKHFVGSWEKLEQFVRYVTPTIKILQITTEDIMDVIDASRWEQLITSSLHQLTIFKFKFYCYRRREYGHILQKFQQFQSDFWCKQHHWHAEYSLANYSTVIYTIPYLSKTYTLTPSMIILPNSRFSNVTDLVLFQSTLTRNYSCYFPNIKSLTLENVSTYGQTDNELFEEKHFEYLKSLVNLYKVKHLTIRKSCKIENTRILLKLFEQSKQLSSLQIDSTLLKYLYNDFQLGLYIKTMIKKLEFFYDKEFLFNNCEETQKFCEIFSNIEQLKCNMIKIDHLLILLTKLSKLFYIRIYSSIDIYIDEIKLFLKEQVSKLDLVFNINQYSKYSSEKLVSIWISRHVN